MNDLTGDAQGLIDALTGADGAVVLWAAVLAAVFKLMISLLRKARGWWPGLQGRRALHLASVTLGVGTFMMAKIAGGMPWWQALLLGFAGPGSVAIHEYSQWLRGQ